MHLMITREEAMYKVKDAGELERSRVGAFPTLQKGKARANKESE